MDQQKLHKAHLMKQKKRLHEQVALASQLYKNLSAELASIEETLKSMEPQPIKTIKQEQKVSVVIKDKNASKPVSKSFKETYSAPVVDDMRHNVYVEEFSKIRMQ
jgi:hypothetical protein